MKHFTSHISDHLLLAVTLAFAGGIALSPLVELLQPDDSLFTTVLISSLMLLVVFYLLDKSKIFLCLLIPIVIAIGIYHGTLQLQLPTDKSHIYHKIKEKTEVVLIGTMASMAGFDGRTSQVIIEAKSIRLQENADLLPAQGKISLRLQGPWPDQFSPGDTLAIRTDLKRPDSFKTPGVFDYAQYLARKDIWIAGFVRSPFFLHKIEEPHSLLHTLRYLPERVRTTIGRQIDIAVPKDKSGVYRAILLGDRSHIDESTLEIFKGSGTMHILAISGLHMAVIGTLLYTGFFWLLSRSEKLLLRYTLKKWAAFLSLPILLGYGLLAGMNTPVFRAVIMSALVIIAICSNRQKSPGTLVASAALLILVIDPLQLFAVSFQLSFTAIIGIFFLLPVLQRLLDDSPKSASPPSIKKQAVNWIAACLLVSLVANLATAPIALYSFNRFPLIGPLANLIIEPLICLWGLGAGFLSLPFIFIQPEISSFLLQIGALGLGVAIHAASFLASFSFSTIWLPTPPLWSIMIYFCILIYFAASGWKKRWGSLVSIFSLSLCIALFFFPPKQHMGEDTNFFRISYLDVGQGTATLLEYPSGFRVLIDGGGSSFTTASVGERVIAPFLWKKGIQNIDAIAITHPDADHYNGLDFIIEHFSPKTLWVRDKNGHDGDFKRLIQQAEKQGITVTVPETNDHLLKGTESLACLANMANMGDTTGSIGPRDSGNSGLILKAWTQQISALFPGDIGRSKEKSLINQGIDINADVLLAPHHGSITSNSSQFLAAVTPKYLLVSAGRSLQEYFPHKGLAQECENQQIDLFTTSNQGTLVIIAKKDGYQLYGYSKKNGNPLLNFHPVLLDEVTFTPR